jgi:hypothetical protein
MPSVDIRGVQRATGSGDAQQQAGMDGNKNLLTAQGMPVYAEMSRLGESYTVGTATLFAPLVARPTTTAALEVFNNSSTRVMVVADLYAEQILSTAAQQTYGIYAMITTTKAIPTLTALTLFSNSGKASVTPTAAGEVVTGVGTTVVANGWRPWGPVQAWGLATATPGNSWSVPVDGKLIVPPQTSICLHIVGALATASTFHVGLTFNWATMRVEA